MSSNVDVDLLKAPLLDATQKVATEVEGLLFTLNGIGPLANFVPDATDVGFKFDKFPKAMVLLAIAGACCRTASNTITGGNTSDMHEKLLLMIKALERALLNSKKENK